MQGIYEGEEYRQAMKEAQEEFAAWERKKRRDHKMNKDK